jgi:hypothetical protein
MEEYEGHRIAEEKEYKRKMESMDYAQEIKFQEGPIKEVGVNGAQVDDVLTVCLGKIKEFNINFSCAENAYAIQHLQETLFWLRERRENRVKRGVEGFSRL